MHLDPLPDACLVDRTLAIRVRGLPAGATITVQLYNALPGGTVFLSQAVFVADAEGVVDLERQAPVSGSYRGVDPMGLFWSRASAAGSAAANCGDASKDPMTLTLKVACANDGHSPVSHTIKRAFTAPDVKSREVRERGLVGHMFEPAHGGLSRAVLVVGGSGGGLGWSREVAALLASHGYAALALAYFAAEGLPATLDRIPLEYFGTALGWLTDQPSAAPRQIAVVGASRGGELALLLGATYPSIRAVVAYVPSGIAWSAYPANGHGAWTQGGKEIPCASTLSKEALEQARADGIADADSFDAYFVPLRDAKYAERASIPVERIGGPVLMISGANDRLWPARELTEFAVERLRKSGFPHRFEHLSYPDAGHAIGWPHVTTTTLKSTHPVSGEKMDMGGTAEGTARAAQDAWPRMLAFLQEALHDR